MENIDHWINIYSIFFLSPFFQLHLTSHFGLKILLIESY